MSAADGFVAVRRIVRPKRVENLLKTPKRELARRAAEYPEAVVRPRTYGECQSVGLGTVIPCPFAGCAHNLYLDVDDRFTPSASVRTSFPGRDHDEMETTCALAAAERGGMSEEEVAAALGVDNSTVGLIEKTARDLLGATRIVRSLAGRDGAR